MSSLSLDEITKWKHWIILSRAISRTASSATLRAFMLSLLYMDTRTLGQELLGYVLISHFLVSNPCICDTQQRSIFPNFTGIMLHVGRLLAPLYRQTGRGSRHHFPRGFWPPKVLVVARLPAHHAPLQIS